MGETRNGESGIVKLNWSLLKLIEGGEAQVYNADRLYKGKALKLYEGWDPEPVRFYTALLKQSQRLVGGQKYNGHVLEIIVPDEQLLMTDRGPATLSEFVRGHQVQFDPAHTAYMQFLNDVSLTLQKGLGNHDAVIVPKNAMITDGTLWKPARLAVTDIATQVRRLVAWR